MHCLVRFHCRNIEARHEASSGARREASFPQKGMPPGLTSHEPLLSLAFGPFLCGRQEPAIDGLLCAGKIAAAHRWPLGGLGGACAPTLAMLLSQNSLQGLLQAMQALIAGLGR